MEQRKEFSVCSLPIPLTPAHAAYHNLFHFL